MTKEIGTAKMLVLSRGNKPHKKTARHSFHHECESSPNQLVIFIKNNERRLNNNNKLKERKKERKRSRKKGGLLCGFV